MKNHVFERLSEAQKQHLESSFDIVLDLDKSWIDSSLPFDYMTIGYDKY